MGISTSLKPGDTLSLLKTLALRNKTEVDTRLHLEKAVAGSGPRCRAEFLLTSWLDCCFQEPPLPYRTLKILKSPLDCKEIKPVNPKGNESSIFIARTDAEAEAEDPILWPPHMKNWLIGKDPDAGKDWRQAPKKVTEDEMAGWPH